MLSLIFTSSKWHIFKQKASNLHKMVNEIHFWIDCVHVFFFFKIRYLLHKASDDVTERSHIFSSFFYKQLTRRDNASEGITKDAYVVPARE